MSNESSYIFMLRAGGSELEVSHNEQSGDVHISEAQIFLKCDHVEGGCLFFIDEVYDMDKLISYLSEIREKMVKHYAAKPDQSLAEAIACGPYCTQCGNPQTKEEIGARISICFDCEKKQILQASLIQGRKDYDEYLTTMEYEGKIKHEHEAKIKMCKHIECDNEAEPGFTKCKLHLNSHIKHVDNVIVCEDVIPVICLVNRCKKLAIGATGYCNDHISNYAPIRRNIKPTDITKQGC